MGTPHPPSFVMSMIHNGDWFDLFYPYNEIDVCLLMFSGKFLVRDIFFRGSKRDGIYVSQVIL